MQPLKLRISGEFWDSLLYSGRLYLWDFENRLSVYDWDRLIESAAEDSAAIECAFARSDLLYRVADENVLLGDPLITEALAKSFSLATSRTLDFSLKDIEFAKISEQENPCGAMHDDAAVHMNRLYLLTESGIYEAGVEKGRSKKYAVKRKADRRWDGVAVGVDAKSGWLALAAASDGVLQLDVREEASVDEPESISKHHATFVRWAFSSVYASSDISGGSLIGFTWQPSADAGRYPWDLPRRRERVGEFSDSEILRHAELRSRQVRLSWAADDKIYFAGDDAVTVCDFTQKYLEDAPERAFHRRGNVPLHARGQLLSAAACLFGTVIETTAGVAVLLSDGSEVQIQDTPVRWRVFARSKRYENQLHLVFDHHLEVLSFNHDYMTNQQTKIVGTEYRKSKRR